MNSIKTIIKFELIRYFSSPLAYIYLIGFLILSGSLAIYFGHFFIDGNAYLWGFFDYQPWIYLLFIPCISMRSWAEEFRLKSIINLLTMPVSPAELVWGKFFASWIFIIFAISLTFPFWIIVNLYGNPDNLVIFISYIGCFILAGAILAISQTMSALTKSSIISLVLSVFVNLFFFWSGFEYVLFWARALFSESIVDTIISFSFLTHFSSLSRGLVELRDLIFFFSLIVFFNLLTIAIIITKTKGSFVFIKSNSKSHCFLVVVLLFIGFFSLNIIANNTLRLFSYDFTEEKYLTLTKNTKDVLRNLKNQVTARLYYSPILEKRNPQIRVLFDQIKLMLKQYKLYSGGKFDYRIYMPNFLDKIEDKALADGIQPIPLIDINQNALFGIVFSNNLTGKKTIPFFSLENLPSLEQDFTTHIYSLQHKKKTVGLLTSLPIMGNVRQESIMLKKWEIINKISELYNIKEIKNVEDLAQPIDVLMIVHPRHLSDDMIEEIKKKEKVLLLLDVSDDASHIYSPSKSDFTASDINDLSDYWNFNFYTDSVVADFDNSITVDETINYKKNPSFTQDLLQFIIPKHGFNPNHRITYKLNNVLFSSATMIFPKNETDIYFFPLIVASRNSSLMPAYYAQKNVHPREVLANFTPSNNLICLAAEILSNDAKKPFDIIAVGDTDFIYDSFWTSNRQFLDSTYYIPLFDSSNFILNALDYLTKNDDLIQLRGKGLKKRLFYKIENLRKENIYRFKLKENDIFDAIDGARQQLVELSAKKDFEERQNFNSDELSTISKIRKEISSLRQQLSDLRQSTNQNISSIEVRVKFICIFSVSLFIILLIFIFNLRKIHFCFSAIKDLFVWDKFILKLFSFVLIILLIALFTIYVDNKNNISKYEDLPVFKDFNSKINKINKIQLKNHTSSLTFVQNNGVWVLEEFPFYPVKQERIRNLIIAISNMTFAEKKSDKIEDMKYFGFSPLANDKSPMISFTIFDNKQNIIEAFDVGWYDIDLGRGSKAAYIRLNNQFQIWLAEVDFYDLSFDKKAWVYGSLWDLNFGRFFDYNGITDNVKVMNFAKNLINTDIIDITDNLSVEPFSQLKIDVENNNFIKILFYKDANKYYVSYKFITEPQGLYLEFFAKYVKDKFLEISPQSWDKIKDDTVAID